MTRDSPPLLPPFMNLHIKSELDGGHSASPLPGGYTCSTLAAQRNNTTSFMLPVEFNCGVLSGGGWRDRSYLEGSPWFNNLVFFFTAYNIQHNGASISPKPRRNRRSWPRHTSDSTYGCTVHVGGGGGEDSTHITWDCRDHARSRSLAELAGVRTSGGRNLRKREMGCHPCISNFGLIWGGGDGIIISALR